MAGRRGLVVGAGALVVVLVAGVVAWRSGLSWPGLSWPGTRHVTVADEGSLYANLPAQISARTGAKPLPDNVAVGRAAFFYTSVAEAGPVFLVTADGAVYRIGTRTSLTDSLHVALSGDGRWLATERDGRNVLRDLTSTTERVLAPDEREYLWSPDSRYLLTRTTSESHPASMAVLDLSTGESHDVALAEDIHRYPIGLLNDHEMVVVDPVAAAPGSTTGDEEKVVTVSWIDLTSGNTLRQRRVDLAPQLASGEYVHAAFLTELWSTGGDPAQAWVEIGVPFPDHPGMEAMIMDVVAAVGIDLRTGDLLGRVEWAAGQKGDITRMAGVVTEGVVLEHVTDRGYEVILATPSGQRRVVTVLPDSMFLHAAGTLT